MSKSSDILISVEERHARSMLNGLKSVELRKKYVNVLPGTRIWIYSKLPVGMIQVVACVDRVEMGLPADIWHKFRSECAISKHEFDNYFEGSKSANAIVLSDVRPVTQDLSLSQIRETVANFQPPQFFKRLDYNSPELGIFNAALASS